MKKSTIYILVVIAVILIGSYFVFNKPKQNISNNNLPQVKIDASKDEEEGKKNVGMANPASVNCKDKGGTLVMEKDKDGGQYGLCYFDDGRACEEWAMMRGECPVGGVKTTGYDTIDQKYCAWRGGATKAEASSTCLFKNGKKCLTVDFYNGTCGPND